MSYYHHVWNSDNTEVQLYTHAQSPNPGWEGSVIRHVGNGTWRLDLRDLSYVYSNIPRGGQVKIKWSADGEMYEVRSGNAGFALSDDQTDPDTVTLGTSDGLSGPVWDHTYTTSGPVTIWLQEHQPFVRSREWSIVVPNTFAAGISKQLIDNHTTSAGRNGDHYRFNASAADSTDTVTWDFGDGTTGTTTGTGHIDHLYELSGLVPGQPVTVTMTINDGAAITETFDLYYMACDYPADEVEVTVVPFQGACSLFKNAEPWTVPDNDIWWYSTKQDGSAFQDLDMATGSSGNGLSPSISQYYRKSSGYAMDDGDYRIRSKVTTGGIERWMDQPFSINISPDVEIVNVDAGDTVSEGKIIVARAESTDGTDISDDIQWEVRNSSNTIIDSTHTGGIYPLTRLYSAPKNSRYSFKVTVTSSGQTVTDEAGSVLMTEHDDPVSDLTINTLFLHPIQKATGRALWNGTWLGLMDDMGSGKRRGYSQAVGGGVVGGTIEDRMNIGTGVFDTSDELYNSTIAGLKGLKEIYKFYDEHVVANSNGATGKRTTGPNGYVEWAGATSGPFKISEFYGVVLHTFYVKVENDTSGTLYSTDGNGKITIVVNQGTGLSTIEIAGTAHTGKTNNTGATGTGLEGDTDYTCKVHAMHGSTKAATSVLTVRVARDGNNWSATYGGITYTCPNKRPMFFYCGSPMANPNPAAKYGKP